MFKIALIQMKVTAEKSQNLIKATSLIKTAAESGAKLVILPECFNSPYGTKYFASYAETIPGESTNALAEAARANNVFLIGGSIPEKIQGSTSHHYNTCTVFSPSGHMLGKYRKMHLFDINIPGKMVFKESEILEPGNELLMFDTENCKVGIGICYDVRFAELGLLYARLGCHLLVYPGAFNTTTGPLHWSLLARGRALDTQCFVALCSPARDPDASYQAYGHSLLTNPWAETVAEAQHDEEILYADVDMARLHQIRSQIPISSQRRTDVYSLSLTSKEAEGANSAKA